MIKLVRCDKTFVSSTWSKVDSEIRRTDFYVCFRNNNNNKKKQKKQQLSFIKPTENETSSIDNPLEVKPLNRLRILP